MVKGRQGNLKIFEIEACDENRLKEYINRNCVLLQNFLLLISQEITPTLVTFLEERGLIFMELKHLEKLRHAQKTLANHKIPEAADSDHEKHPTTESIKAQIFSRIIRSGEEIVCEGDLVIYGRINSGARIYAKGNLQIYGEIDGAVECEGEFVLLTKIGQGSVLFAGEFLDPNVFDGNKKAIFKDGKTLQISA